MTIEHDAPELTRTEPSREAEWALNWAETIFGRARREQVFDQAVSDMRLEIVEARAAGKRLAVAFARIRGWLSILRAAKGVAVLRLLLRYALFRHIV